MINSITNQMIQALDKYLKKDVDIIQDGFMQAQYTIENLNYGIEEDILKVVGNNKQLLSININIINKITLNENALKIYLDNDTTIEFKS